MQKWIVFFITLFFVVSLSADTSGRKTKKTINEKHKSVFKYSIPIDHGPHDDVMYEWWYFSGDAKTASGRQLGYHVVILKYYLDFKKGFIFGGQAAVSDLDNNKYYFIENMDLSNDMSTVAGVAEIDIEGFYYNFKEPRKIQLRVDTPKIKLDFNLSQTKDLLEYESEDTDNNAHRIYSRISKYALTNLVSKGGIRIGDEKLIIDSGRTWLEHYWGNYNAQENPWDWFSLRFDDGAALEITILRDVLDFGRVEKWVYRDKNGQVKNGRSVNIKSKRIFEDKIYKATYPIDWVVEIPEIQAKIHIKPKMDDQAIKRSEFRNYWEGLCSVTGSINKKDVSGSAYAELTGYENDRASALTTEEVKNLIKTMLNRRGGKY